MDQAKRIVIIILLVSGLTNIYGQAEQLTSREVDQRSFELYQAGQWKELIRFTDKAFSQGFDYYYLRIRAGVACFETRRYQKAVLHFEKALIFNANDYLAGEYLFGCYIALNRSREAYEIYDKLPPSSREKLVKNLPKIRNVYVSEGLISCNQADKMRNLDLDGEDNIYGEAEITQEGNYFNAGLSWGFQKGYNVNAAYTLATIHKNKTARIGDTLSLDDQYPVKQHQVYLSGNIPLGKGYSVQPAFNMVMQRYEEVMPQLSADSASYNFPLIEFRYNNCIGFLSVTKDYSIVRATLFTAFSNLNDKQQFQAGFEALVFPFGNLDLYASSKLLNHMNDGVHHILFEQMIGSRVSKNVWAEVNGTFGHMNNYYERSGFVVYNLVDEMKFKGGARLMVMIYPHWMLSLDYLYLLREGNYIYYTLQENGQVAQVQSPVEFSNNIFLLGLNWKF